MPKIRKRLVLEGIFLLEFPSQYELAATCLRFQEHYESSRFRGRTFSLEQYMDWYASVWGNFTYYEDWTGFNFPSRVLEPFRRGRFDPLLVKERRLLDLVRGEREPFYVIGLSRERGRIERTTLEHELAHGLFHMRHDYRREVLACLREHNTSAIQRRFAAQTYHRRVLLDEVHAYLLAERPEPTAERRVTAPLRRRLRSIFRKHCNQSAVDRLLGRGR